MTKVLQFRQISYRGFAAKLNRSIAKLSYRGRPFLSLPIEVAAPEGDALDVIDQVVVAPLVELGLGGPGPVPIMNVPYQICPEAACLHGARHRHVHERPRP